MREYEVIDRSYNKEASELQQFTVLWENGAPDLKRATAENVLLFDPEDVLPFEGGLYGFLNGEEAIILSRDDPEAMVAPTGNEYAYIVRINGDTVESTPKQAESVLEGIREAIMEREFDELISVYDEIRKNQVRKHVVNALYETFDELNRIQRVSEGWLVDGFYLVDWSASMYTRNDDPNQDEYERGGGGVMSRDKRYEFVNLNISRDLDPVEVRINGEKFRLSEREMLFLAKVKWLLGRRHYHPDDPFWMYNDKWAEVDSETGKPVKEKKDGFNPNKPSF